MSVTFVPTDPAEILQEILVDFNTVTGRTPLPSQPEYLICSAIAYRVALERQRQNTVGNSQLLEFSTAPIIDYLVGLVGISRLPQQYATTTLQFTLVAGHGDVVIPQNTRVTSTDGQVVFATVADLPVAAETLVVNVGAECQTPGIIGNGYAIGTITEIQDVQSYLSACTNIAITTGGSDAETDVQLRARAFLAPSGFSVAGSRNAYKFFAFSASPLIVDVAVVTHKEDDAIPLGQINIYPLLENATPASNELLESIETILSDDTVRPLSDTVVVVNPTVIEYILFVSIIKYTNAISQDIINLINPILLAYGAEKIKTMGLDIVKSEIVALCRVEGVYDVTIEMYNYTLETGIIGNLVVEANQVPVLREYTTTITGTNNG